MYVGTIVEYDDQSAITSLPIADVRVNPLYLSVFTSDKGPEDWTELQGKDWFTAYGNSISFAKHGQPLLQSAIAINAGARLLSKRLVASDATLANMSIVASISTQTVNTYSNGAVVIVDPEDSINLGDGIELVSSVTTNTIKYEGITIPDITENDPELVYEAVKAQIGEGKYHLFTITDNGRGLSNKRFNIIPNYRLSKSKDYVEYSLTVSENGINLESMIFSAIPGLIVDGVAHTMQSVVKNNSKQICCYQNDEGLEAFIKALADTSDVTVDEIKAIDFLNGYNKKGVKIDSINVDESGLNLQNAFGHSLLSGTNGAFGDCPIDSANEAEYVKQAEYALGVDSTNVYDTLIYDLDRYKIELCVDANYPAGVKRAIETLATFREDFVFLRDMGLGLNSLEAIKLYNDELLVKNKFIATYCTSYDIIDPYSKKQIPVTIGYSLARLMVDHLNAGRILPACGIKHDMIIDEAIKGTLNFAPVVCPEPLGNQKEVMEEIAVNYATYIGEDLVIETEYTSQEMHTQFSFMNNILATQEVVRAIRSRCPVIRYSFIDGEDLERYKADIEDVIARYASNFKSITFDYVNDPVYVNNKIFYAAINVGFRDFIQTEWFKVTAINVTEA